jgi:hypothetical protein
MRIRIHDEDDDDEEEKKKKKEDKDKDKEDAGVLKTISNSPHHIMVRIIDRSIKRPVSIFSMMCTASMAVGAAAPASRVSFVWTFRRRDSTSTSFEICCRIESGNCIRCVVACLYWRSS